MKLSLILILFFSSTAVLSTEKNPTYCGLNEPQPDVVIPSNDVSGNYWTNLLDDHTVMFTAEGGVSGNYQAYDLNTHQKHKLTNQIDPFPVPDGRRIYIHPSPIEFFEYDKILKKVEAGSDQLDLVSTDGVSPKEDKEARSQRAGQVSQDTMLNHQDGDKDSRMWGYYESVGVLKSSKKQDDNYSEYRVLTGQGEGAFKDYRVNFNEDGTIKSVDSTSKAKLMCPNWRFDDKVDLQFDTPILSPKGDEFAITDRSTNSTKIIKFDPETGNCELALDLGFEAGKVHFSPDGSKIAFHTQSLNIGAATVSTRNNRGYFIDRKTNSITSLQVGKPEDNTSEQYPSFLPDGRILYQRVKFDFETGMQSRAWVKVDPKKLNTAKFVTKDDCLEDANLPLVAIGKLYSQVCATLNPNDSLIWTLDLDPMKCKRLVNDKWFRLKPMIMEGLNKGQKNKIPEDYLTRQMLLSACPTKAVGAIKTLTADAGTKMKYPAIIGQRCVVCHVIGSPRGYIPFDRPERLRGMMAIGKSAQEGGPYFGKTFLEQITDILKNNEEGKIPPEGIPRVPADGPRLKNDQIKEIVDWVENGKEVE